MKALPAMEGLFSFWAFPSALGSRSGFPFQFLVRLWQDCGIYTAILNARGGVLIIFASA
tara:strand:- start:1099 stop:1275 length:177 start_codon:yes stop_codon:yes gene_type:complete